MTTTYTYDGRYARATVHLPSGPLQVERGTRYPIADDDLDALDPNEWAELRPAKATAGPPTAAEVVKGKVPEVLDAAGTDPAAAAELLAAEEAGRNRPSLVAALRAIANPSDSTGIAANPTTEG